MTQEILKLAFQKAFQMGQDYWYHANHEFESYNKKSDAIRAKFNEMVKETIEEALTQEQEPVVYQCPRCATSMQVDLTAKAALAQTQEPVAWQLWVGADTPLNAPMGWQFYSTYDSLKSAEVSARTINSYKQAPFAKIVPLYTTPPQRTWVGLTDEQIVQCQQGDIYHFYRCIEAKLKKENGL